MKMNLFIDKHGEVRNTVLVWTACLVMIGVVSLLILPKLIQSGNVLNNTQICATHTVQPVSCSIIEGDTQSPWKVNIQMTEPVDPNVEGTLTSLRATVGGVYADLRHNQRGFPYARGQLIQIQIIGNAKGEAPIGTQVVVDSIYTLPSGSTTLCRSLPLTCT